MPNQTIEQRPTDTLMRQLGFFDYQLSSNYRLTAAQRRNYQQMKTRINDELIKRYLAKNHDQS